MFSGIIEEVGTVRLLDKNGPIAKLQVQVPDLASCSRSGQSICVNGVCLTVIEAQGDLLKFEVMQETLKRTSLGSLIGADRVNLERALRADGRLDGHFLTGHIDATGRVKRRQKLGSDVVLEIEASDEVLRYLVLKGAVALDGVSLTVSAVTSNSFSVCLIPYTLNNTTLGLNKEEEIVNIECDILAKYTEKTLSLQQQPRPSNISMSFLRRHGFTS